jgi:hypothetical protein
MHRLRLTAASLHILQPRARSAIGLAGFAGRRPDPAAALDRALANLGWRPAAEDAVPGREVVLRRHGRFVSLHDPTWLAPREERVDVAARLSRDLRTTVVATALNEESGFEFVLFRDGEQVDAATTLHGERAWASLRGRPQALLWRTAFGKGHIAAVAGPGSAPLQDPLDAFSVLAGEASRLPASPPAAALAAWCRLAGLPLDALGEAAPAGVVISRRGFVSGPVRARRPGGRVQRFDAGVADCPYHGFYPGAWPVPASAVQSFVWPLVCRGGALRRFRLALHIDRGGAFVLRKVTVAAYAYRNGQIAGAAPLAQFGHAVLPQAGGADPELSFDVDTFGLRDLMGRKDAAYALLIRAEIATPETGEMTVTPVWRAGGARKPPLILPTLRLAVTLPRWTPVVADPLDENAGRRQAVLRLNAAPVHSCVAILPDTGGELRHALRAVAEDFLAPMTGTALLARLHVEQHMRSGLTVPRVARTVPMRTLFQDAAWPGLFDGAGDVQTLRIGISLPDAHAPLAGIVVQASLRDAHGGAANEPLGAGSTLAAAFWALTEDSALALLRMDIAAMRAGFAAFMRGAAPLQAWCGDCAWIPEFDRYGAYALTPYEAAAAVDWFGRGLAGTLGDRTWSRRRLRFVAPRMWLGWEMLELIDATALTSFAHVAEVEDGMVITLRNPGDLARLEKALLPILPLRV